MAAGGKDGSPKLPLSGIRVLDVTHWMQGPVAAMMLADMGAEVIHVEKRGSGDFTRGCTFWAGTNLITNGGKAIMWELANRNKKSITLDLTHEKARSVLHRLLKNCDVMVTNMLPGILARAGLDYDTVSQVNRQLVYVSGSTYGHRGPDAGSPGQDTTGLAHAGFLTNMIPDRDEPVYPVSSLSDMASGTMMAFGAVCAILARERLGIGQAVYSSQLATMVWLQTPNVVAAENIGQQFVPFDRRTNKNPLVNFYRCKDGKWIALGCYASDRIWKQLCLAVGVSPHVEQDSRFKNEQARAEHCGELIAILDEAFATKSSAEWERILKDNRILFSVANSVSDLSTDPQVAASGLIAEFPDGLKLTTSPFEFSKTRMPPRGRSPELGEHTEEVLVTLGGYSRDEVEALRREAVI